MKHFTKSLWIAFVTLVVSSLSANAAPELDKNDYTPALVAEAKRGAEEDNIEQQAIYGRALANGWGVEENATEAVVWLKKAAEAGNSSAQCSLGDCYCIGAGVTKDMFKAIKLWTNAAEQGHARAQYNLGQYFFHYAQNGDASSNVLAAVKWWTRSAEQGYADAQLCLGVFYFTGSSYGIDRDVGLATKWLTMAAEQGHVDAQFNLGFRYLAGKGVAKDSAKAVEWLTKAAKQGHADAQYWLGEIYSRGDGIPKDLNKSVYWMTKAAEQENAKAQFVLFLTYASGADIPKDNAKAIEWLKKAAEHNLDDAQFYLGIHYYLGDGVEKSISKAMELWAKAAAQGHERARQELAKLREIAAKEQTRLATTSSETTGTKSGGIFAKSMVDKDNVEAIFKPVFHSFYWNQYAFFNAWVKKNPDGTFAVQYDVEDQTAVVSIGVAVNESAWRAWKNEVAARLAALPVSNTVNDHELTVAGKKYRVSPTVFKTLNQIVESMGPYPDWGILVQLTDGSGNVVANQFLKAHWPRGYYVIKKDPENVCGSARYKGKKRWVDGVYWLVDALNSKEHSFDDEPDNEWRTSCPTDAVFYGLTPEMAETVVDVQVHILEPKMAKRYLLENRKPFSIAFGKDLSLEMMPTPGGIWMGKTEVTQAVWEKVMGNNPIADELRRQRSLDENREVAYLQKFLNPNNPVSLVSRTDCIEFIRRLNALPEVVGSGYVFRLPEDWEWELAARGNLLRGDLEPRQGYGDVTEWYYGWGRADNPGHSAPENYGWFRSNSEKHSHPVASKLPNEFGLYDMIGNVSEIIGTIPPSHTLRSAERNGSSGCSENPFEWGDFIHDDADYSYHFEWIGFRLAAEPSKTGRSTPQ